MLLFFELILLYFLSRWLTKSLYILLLLVFRARSVAISLLLALLFPGTVIHELAHLFTAEILGVHTGKLTLVPDSIREADIRSGSVAIAESDPFRRYAIGFAPLVWGSVTLVALAYLLQTQQDEVLQGIALYLLFAVSNSMFPSPADLKGFWPFALTLGLFAVAGFWLGIRIPIPVEILTTLTDSLKLVIIVNSVLLVASWGLRRVVLRVLAWRA